MIEVVVYLGIVLAIAGVGVWLGMILAGRLDRRLNSPDADEPEPPSTEES